MEIIHKDLEKAFDCRAIQSKQSYLRCLLQLDSLLEANPNIISGQPQSYYQLVLRKVHVEAQLGDKAYVEQLRLLDGGAPKALPPPAVPALEDDFDVVCDGEGAPASPIAPKADPARRGRGAGRARGRGAGRGRKGPNADSSSGSSSSSSSSSSSNGAGSDASFDVVDGRSKVSDWIVLPSVPDAPRFKLDEYKPKHKSSYHRWICECKAHPDCTKKRSTTICGLHGKVEPIAFLMAWQKAGSATTKEQHVARNFRITPEMVAREVVLLGNKADMLLAKLL
jgi:hypothetical protein